MNETLLAPSYKGSIECIESWHNEDYSLWYRKYSDGFIEQGGQLNLANTPTTVNLNIPFNTNVYAVIATPSKNYNNYGAMATYNQTTTNFSVVATRSKEGYSCYNINWIAKGY